MSNNTFGPVGRGVIIQIVWYRHCIVWQGGIVWWRAIILRQIMDNCSRQPLAGVTHAVLRGVGLNFASRPIDLVVAIAQSYYIQNHLPKVGGWYGPSENKFCKESNVVLTAERGGEEGAGHASLTN